MKLLRSIPRFSAQRSTTLFKSRAIHSSPILAVDPTFKPSVKLISKIRSSNPGVTLSLARSALIASSNDFEGALQWISDQSAVMGAAKAKKLEGRTAAEGLVGVALFADGTGGVGVRGAMVELSCETSFVARTAEFCDLLEGITRSVAFFAEPPFSTSTAPGVAHFVRHQPSSLFDVPLVPPPSAKAPPAPLSTVSLPTVSSAILSTITKVGENITLRRALSISINPTLPKSTSYLASTYIHGSRPSSTGDPTYQSGSLASLLVLKLPPGGDVSKDSIKTLARALARQVVAQPTNAVLGSAEADTVDEQSKALYEQPLITLAPHGEFQFEQGSSVAQVLKAWSESRKIDGEGLEVTELERWEVGTVEDDVVTNA